MNNQNDMKRRNPKWTRDELILALDLYFRHNPNHINSNHKEVIKLSKILRSLPIYDDSLKEENFRNTNSVYSKMSNFLWLDSNYPGKGRENGSKLDEIVWNEFHNDKTKLHNIAKSILSGTTAESEVTLQPIDHDEEEEFPEGKILYRVHKSRERNGRLIKKKKQIAIQNDKLSCEICNFDFYKTYGEFGKGFIECHHTVPVSEYQNNTTTKLNDLILVCSNCHRMLHRRRPWLTKEKLSELIM
jgi:5-methylcytosine-specific restriction enzyme A